MNLRFVMIASAVALGLAIGLQPLSFDFNPLKPEVSQAYAAGSDIGRNGDHCQIVGYEMAMLNNDIVTAAKTLANLAKPGVPENAVVALNEELQIQTDPQTFADLVAKAREFQTVNQ